MSFSVATEEKYSMLNRGQRRWGQAPKGSQSHRPPTMLKYPTSQQKKTCLQPGTKVVLVYIANFALHDNCEEVNICITHPFKLY